VVLDLSPHEYLRALRAKQGLTQQAFARRIETTQPTVSAWERVVGSPSEDDWQRIQREFGKIELARSTTVSCKTAPDEMSRQCRTLLDCFARFGELTRGEIDRLGIAPDVLAAWTDSLVSLRPSNVLVATPLFLSLVGKGTSPAGFTTQLAVLLMGEQVQRVMNDPVESLERHVWEHFGAWHLPQPQAEYATCHGYLAAPAIEAADKAACGRLDLYAQLPSSVLAELVRDPEFLSEQQRWSAQAAGKNNLGVLSRQIKVGVRRPLFLSHCRLPEIDGGQPMLASVPESDVLTRTYVVAGLPLCTHEEWTAGGTLSRDDLTTRLLEHPLHAVILQFEAHRMMASLSGKTAAVLTQATDGTCVVEHEGGHVVPLWKTCRALLEDLGFWPVADSVDDSYWASATEVALANLTAVDVLELSVSRYRLTETFASKLKAHPSHPQNRGEKAFRVRLLQHLEGSNGGRR